MPTNPFSLACLLMLCCFLTLNPVYADQTAAWTERELRLLRSLWLGSLTPLSPDPSNRVADDPRAAEFGRRLFFDPQFSANGQIACANCHRPELYFTDGRAFSEGLAITGRGAPSLLGAAYSPWFYWDGRRDSQWSQALVPFEEPVEMGIDRRRVLQFIAADEGYLASYQQLFGPLPSADAGDQAISHSFARVGKVLAAYQRTLLPQYSRFDYYVESLLEEQKDPIEKPPALNGKEITGLRLFISEKTQCTRCHNGPLLSNFGFHNIGLIELKRGVRKYDFGRSKGAEQALQDPFNCLGQYSDAEPSQCGELKFIRLRGKELAGAFKVPTLRNVAETAPYMHDGRFANLHEVVEHYRQAPKRRLGHQELNPLLLTSEQVDQLVMFLKTLTGPTVD